MIGPFQFENGGRTYTCTIEKRTTPPTGIWWWFATSDDQQRYAPFEAAEKDTQRSVKDRIVKFYEARLARLAMPEEPRKHWGGRPPKAVAAAKEAEQEEMGDLE
jgi:hypothetical protein